MCIQIIPRREVESSAKSRILGENSKTLSPKFGWLPRWGTRRNLGHHFGVRFLWFPMKSQFEWFWMGKLSYDIQFEWGIMCIPILDIWGEEFGWLPRWGPRRNYTRVVRAFLGRKILYWLWIAWSNSTIRKMKGLQLMMTWKVTEWFFPPLTCFHKPIRAILCLGIQRNIYLLFGKVVPWFNVHFDYVFYIGPLV